MRRHHLPEESAFIFKQVVQHSANAIFITDSQAALTFANEAGESLYLRLQQSQQLALLLSADHPQFELTDGRQPQWLHCQVAPLTDQRYSGFLVIATDITTELHAQREEAHLRWRLEQTMEITEEGFWFWDMQSNEITHNHFWRQIFAIEDEELTHPVYALEQLIHPDDRDEVKRQMREHLRGHTPMFNCQYRIVTPHDEIRWIHNTGKAVRHDGKGMATEMVGKAKDITAEMQRQQEMHHLAWHDQLTQLDNRSRFLHKIELSRQLTQLEGEYAALLYLDLNRFKEVNDTLGHNAGDALLQEVARRLRAAIRSHDAIARLGGDEFAVLVNHLGDNEQEARSKLTVMMNRLLQNLTRDVDLEGSVVSVSSSLGVYLFRKDAGPVADMLHKADMAQYYSKKNRRRWMFWSSRLREEQHHRDTIESGLKRALDNGEFFLEYQPQYSRLGHASGLEALLRWRTPEGKLIAPTTFLPVAESTGLIRQISDWVLNEAGQQLARWHRQPGMEAMRVSVNVSPRHLKRNDFIRVMERVLLQNNIQPHQLTIEVLETALTNDFAEAQRKFNALHDMQVRIALDNFGTGMASLTGLRQLTIDEVKIDRSFVQAVNQQGDYLVTVRAIVAMCQALSIEVVAEGVENSAQFSALADIGCDRFQGWFFSRSLSPDKLVEVL
ncbi:hypothetical protein BTJ39_06520 [Izhakiella australiensis]|uniref:Diguanylate cyclase n=1 Tax=Izhakiella australiensis TaxID=1926881 RepID=A0A1S8YNJ2_9GAMM|nr:GGDEF domain-containing phosphodiesterase [Izhakiella australiensis]OON40731.1 hypothetical protein BTJ39_06520 [Izhakiella australiensis]